MTHSIDTRLAQLEQRAAPLPSVENAVNEVKAHLAAQNGALPRIEAKLNALEEALGKRMLAAENKLHSIELQQVVAEARTKIVFATLAVLGGAVIGLCGKLVYNWIVK